MEIHVFGVRHHGPGCARALVEAVAATKPDLIAVEGPADAASALDQFTETLVPPVALLVYSPELPQQAAFYPFAEFSPEWQALRWAKSNQVPIRLMDLPQSQQMPMLAEKATTIASEAPEGNAPEAADAPADPEWRADPIGLLAEAAGFADSELWWEEEVERRRNAVDLFAAIQWAMRAVREEIPTTNSRDLLREAHMRTVIRSAVKDGAKKIAVVCGAYHSSVLDQSAIENQIPSITKKDDDARLKGLKKIKTLATWIPWTYGRLASATGYGAGVYSPGWYDHLWHVNEKVGIQWISRAARFLRKQDLDASSASVIETARLADALAAIRERRAVGLDELNEAMQAVLCHGDAGPMLLIRRHLEVGERIGEVPADVATVPLAADLARLQKSLRLPASPESKLFDLDLRKENDLARSQLLHRLGCLAIPWGNLERRGGGSSTFHEIWRLEWKPEFALNVIEASVWGMTVPDAAAARVLDLCQKISDLPKLCEWLDDIIMAGLEPAIEPLLARIQTVAAIAADVRHMLEAVPSLARVARYGDVRGTKASTVEPIIVGLFERILVGLLPAIATLDEEAAEVMVKALEDFQSALDLLSRADLAQAWVAKLQMVIRSGTRPLLAGWACRSLVDRGVLTGDDLYQQACLALSPALPPAAAAEWATGLLRGSGLTLLHQDLVWHVFDRWLADLKPDVFKETLPLLRRAFANFSRAERRQMGEKLRNLSKPTGTSAAVTTEIDWQRASKIVPILTTILAGGNKQ